MPAKYIKGNNLKIPTDSLLAWYKLDGDATDSSGNGYDGTEFNTPTYSTGKFSQAIDYAITNQAVQIPAAINDFSNGAFTLSMWIKLEPTINDRKIFYHRKSVSVSPSLFNLESRYTSGNYHGIDLRLRTADGNYQVITTSEDIIDKTRWTNLVVAGSSDGKTVSVYVDNIFVDSVTTVSARGLSFETYCYIGGDGSQPTCLGLYDQVVLYDKELTEDERTQLYELTYKWQRI